MKKSTYNFFKIFKYFDNEKQELGDKGKILSIV